MNSQARFATKGGLYLAFRLALEWPAIKRRKLDRFFERGSKKWTTARNMTEKRCGPGRLI